MKRDVILFVRDTLERIELIENSISKLSKLDFQSNNLIVDATIRRLEVIGEAVKNIPDSFRNKYSDVPWRKIAGLRDIMTHAYFGVDLDIIWKIIKDDIPILKKQIKEILEKENV
ncbi:MAG: DUF86 domain-containing protein [Nanoarchaeota archaeon]|nr:DUF86 domain-containing protein [Nanoarchaeota archaeon]